MITEGKVSPLPWVWGSARYDRTNPGWDLVAADAESNNEVDGLYVGPIGRRMADPTSGAVLYPVGWECDGIVASATDRAFIVRAVNSHAALVEALEGLDRILQRAESNASGNPEWNYVSEKINAARAALAAAKEPA